MRFGSGTILALAFVALFGGANAFADDTTPPSSTPTDSTKSPADQLKEKFGSVNGTTYTGAVGGGIEGGNGEATLLAAKTVREAAGGIVTALTGKIGGGTVIVYAGATRPTFAHWRVVSFLKAVVFELLQGANDHGNAIQMEADALIAAEKEAIAAEEAKRTAEEKKAADEKKAANAAASTPTLSTRIAPLLIPTAIGAGIDIFSKLGSYFSSDYTVGKATPAEGVDDDLLAASVISAIPNAIYPDHWQPHPNDAEAVSWITGLQGVRNSATQFAVALANDKDTLADLIKTATEAKNLDRVKTLTKAANDVDAALAQIAAAAKSYDDFAASLVTAQDGKPLAVLALDEKAISDQVAVDGTRILFVRLNATAGSNYTKKNLWTFFGGIPFYVMGGSVASYVLVNAKDGKVVASGNIPLHGGYYSVDEVEAALGAKPKSPATRARSGNSN